MNLMIGNIQSHMKMIGLKSKFEQNKNDPAKAREEAERRSNMSAEELKIENFKERVANDNEANKVATLEAKVRSGETLTDEEKEYLKQNNPELYESAVRTEEDKKEYEREMKNAKSKEEVERIKLTRLEQYASEMKTVMNNPSISKEKKLELVTGIAGRFQGVLDEHKKFVESEQYQKLPEKSDKASVSVGQEQEKNEVEEKETTTSNEAVTEDSLKETFGTYFGESGGLDTSADLSTLFETSEVSMSDFDGKVLNRKG